MPCPVSMDRLHLATKLLDLRVQYFADDRNASTVYSNIIADNIAIQHAADIIGDDLTSANAATCIEIVNAALAASRTNLRSRHEAAIEALIHECSDLAQPCPKHNVV